LASVLERLIVVMISSISESWSVARPRQWL